ncbi:MAG: transcription-repair coupling factor [Candidatus Delongbacteria bacterium]|jgi:transcription-repair coupling factor (superfamily II helicase)|nr:transcription-repair coupling factor [Candidatus Delongbacteria bacterium]
MSEKLGILYREHPAVDAILQHCRGKNKPLTLKGLVGSAFSILFHTAWQSKKSTHLIIMHDKEKAAYIFNDLQKLTNYDDHIQFYPSAYKRSVEYNQTDKVNIVLKTEVLNRIGSTRKPYVLVSYPEALIESVIARKSLKEQTLIIKKGDELSVSFVEEMLEINGFKKEEFVYEPGDYAIRGGIVDVFSFSNDLAYRIEFFGDEIESIRSFDPQTQISVKKLNKIAVVSNIHEKSEENPKVPFLDFLTDSASLWIEDKDYVFQRFDDIYNKAKKRFQAGINPDIDETPMMDPEQNLTHPDKIKSNIETFPLILLGQQQGVKEETVLNFHTVSQPVFQKNFDRLTEDFQNKHEAGYTCYVLSDNEKQIQRLRDIFSDKGEDIRFESVFYALHEGFIDHTLKTCVYTDHQIFERYHKYHLKSRVMRKDAFTLKELNSLNPGDYVVHVDNGVGKFAGLQKIENNGKQQEVIRLEYADGDMLFVNIHSLHRISKFRNQDGETPTIHRLGSGHWQRIKNKTKKKVKDIARDLILLYATRQDASGFAFSGDNYLQHELESSFIYEDTPDQYEATRLVKQDMEKPVPMDRLVCGDVGFGKTEVGIRAAFKAVNDNKQVAVLVPTTILAFQHHQTFSERLENMPVNVDYISRLKTSSEIKKSLKDLKEGRTDIIIGTHRLVGKDVDFKDLGLLIVDEEQKFGVTTKEKLKKLRLNVDTLTLTATPIPRTMQFSLMGARDLSVINTPPANRHPIITELHTFNKEIIREAIMYEVQRNGQVFFIHNRIQNIREVEAMIERVCPEVQSKIAHGQMEGKKLERIMLEYIRGDFDVMISTAIIENGLDIPNANTIIINNANQFGLSDLHQLRGRVGRSNKKAFCYLIAPPVTHITPDARRRLKAIENFTELGSGFYIALQDLDIRGAGNLLGGEQSGYISDMGYETYQKVLKEAVQELKEEEFKGIFASGKRSAEKVPDDYKFVRDCQIETDHEVLLPEDYIESVSERIRVYRKLDNIENENELQQFEHEMQDRFGDMPEPVKGMLEIVRLRWIAMRTGFQRIVIKDDVFLGFFPKDQASMFYKSDVFAGMIKYMQEHPGGFRLKEDNGKLRMKIKPVRSIKEIRKFLTTLHDTYSISREKQNLDNS